MTVDCHTCSLRKYDNGDKWFCDGKTDGCTFKTEGATVKWSCRKCDYDLCRECVDKHGGFRQERDREKEAQDRDRKTSRKRSSSKKRSRDRDKGKDSHKRSRSRGKSTTRKSRSKSRGRSSSRPRGDGNKIARLVSNRERQERLRSASPQARKGSSSPPARSGAATCPSTHSGEVGRAEVLERKNPQNGEPTWQAEILVNHDQPTTDHAGRARVFTIRGPPRKSQDSADDDAKRLTEAASEGAKAVRALANQMHRH